MDKLAFADGEKIGILDGETTTLFESAYIRRYREYSETRHKNDEWKFGGEGARFRGDYESYAARGNEAIRASINAVQWDGEDVVYAFSVNGSSGLYRKNIRNEKEAEEHIFTSSDEEFLTLHRAGELYAVTVAGDGIVSRIGTLNAKTAELKTLTDGDARDANPFFSADGKRLLFDSAGVGRDGDGNFTGKYAPASLCSIDLQSLEIAELKHSEKYSYVKPKEGADGTLYCIRRPVKEKRHGNLFLDILLIPFRILQAFVMLIQWFVILFTGKPLTSDTAEGDNPAKGRQAKRHKLIIDGNKIEYEKELKRNRKSKEKDYGFIPLSWKLVRLKGEEEEVLKSGVCDYGLCEDGGLYCTNGRHIFYVKEGSCRKVADTDKCLSLGVPSRTLPPADLFEV